MTAHSDKLRGRMTSPVMLCAGDVIEVRGTLYKVEFLNRNQRPDVVVTTLINQDGINQVDLPKGAPVFRVTDARVTGL